MPTLNALINSDPTQTATLRKEFSQRLANRFMIVRRAIRIFVVENDGLNLAGGPSVNKRDLTSVIPMPPRFTFPSSAAKVTAFGEWIDAMEEADILRWMERDGQTYLESAYKAGIQRGQYQAKAAGADLPIAMQGDPVGASFAAPIHKDAVELIYTRAFENLKGITNTMSQRISDTLAQGLTDGINPLQMASNLAGRDGVVKKIGLNRARMLARTEVIRAHAESTLNEFERAGLEGVELETELSLAADACDQCEAKAAEGPWSIKDAHGILPIHPNCRCAFRPVVK